MGNGMVERFNQTLLKMLRTLDENKKSDWKSHVPTLVHAYNATHHEATGYSPYYLMFGRHPRLAIDAFLEFPTDTLDAHTQSYMWPNCKRGSGLPMTKLGLLLPLQAPTAKRGMTSVLGVRYYDLVIVYWCGMSQFEENTNSLTGGSHFPMWLCHNRLTMFRFLR